MTNPQGKIRELWDIYSSGNTASFLLIFLGVLLAAASFIPQGTTEKFITSHYLYSEAKWIIFFRLNNIAASPLSLSVIFLLTVNLSARTLDRVMNSAGLKELAAPSLSAIAIVLAVILSNGLFEGAETGDSNNIIRMENTLSGVSASGSFEAGEVYENEDLKVKTMVVRTSPALLIAVKSEEGLALYSKMFSREEKEERLELSHISSAPSGGLPFRIAGAETIPFLLLLASLVLFIAAFHGIAGEILSGRSAALFAASPVFLLLLLCFATNHLPFPLNSAGGNRLFLNISYFDASLQSDFQTSIPLNWTFAGLGILTFFLILSALFFVFSMLFDIPNGTRKRLILFKAHGILLLLAGAIPFASIIFGIPLDITTADIYKWFSEKIQPVIAPELTILDMNLSGAAPFSLSPAGLLPFLLTTFFYGSYLLLYGFGVIKPLVKKFLPPTALLSLSFLLIFAAAIIQLFDEPRHALVLIGSSSAVSGTLFSANETNRFGSNNCPLIALIILFFAIMIVY